jgi:hypothetical protein
MTLWFVSVNLKISSFAANTVAKHLRNISSNCVEKLIVGVGARVSPLVLPP